MNERKAFYVSQIQDNFLPYWLKFVDREQGGILNCIHNNGDQRLSDNKFTWSQGRWLWVLARVYRLAKQGVLPKVDPAELEPLMDETFRFLAAGPLRHGIHAALRVTRLLRLRRWLPLPQKSLFSV